MKINSTPFGAFASDFVIFKILSFNKIRFLVLPSLKSVKHMSAGNPINYIFNNKDIISIIHYYAYLYII